MKENDALREFYEYWSKFVKDGTSSGFSMLEQASMDIFYDWLKDNYVITKKD